MQYFLGVDVGASKTHALIVSELGRCVGFGASGGGNHQGVGYEGLSAALQEAVSVVLKIAEIDKEQIVGAGFGVAGYDFPSDRPQHLEVIARLGLSCPLEVVNDGVNGLLAGATYGIGVNVTAGSSNNCRGRGKDGSEGRIVGNGEMFGEYGGAWEIVSMALKMVNYAWIKRIPPTALTQVFLTETGATSEMDLMEGLSNGRYTLSAALANQVAAAAKEGDNTARNVLRWAGEELGWLAVSVIRQIGMEKDEVEVIQSGSVFDAGELLIQPMKEIVLANCPRARLFRLQSIPVVGAVILGMEQVGFDGYAVRAQIVESANVLVAKMNKGMG